MALTILDASVEAKMSVRGGLTGQFSNPAQKILETWSQTLAVGTGAGQADQMWADEARALAAGTSEDLDIQAGGESNDLGQAISFSILKFIFIRNNATLANASILAIGGHATNAFINWVGNATDIINIRAQGILILACTDATGYAVSAGDLIKIENLDGSNALTYDIILVGVD